MQVEMTGKQIWVRPLVIVELTGLAMRTVCRDMLRFQWSIRTRKGSPLKFYSLTEIERSYGTNWSTEQVAAAVKKHSRPAAFVEGIENGLV